MKNELEGSVQGHRDGHGFVLRDDGGPDLYLPPAQMRAVLHGDRVRAAVTQFDRKGRAEGRVLSIISRPPRPLIARLVRESGVWLARPEDRRYGQDVLLEKRGLGRAREGQIAVIAFTGEPALHAQPTGRVTEVLGDADDAGMEIEIAVRKFGVPHEFSPAALAQAQALPDAVQPAERKGRIDLTDVPFVTIDGEDARDFDDAVYCQPAVASGRGKRPNGWRLLVAIADVSHYVTNGDALDADAFERATSVYFPRRVIPMLPEKLSNGLCSLNPQVDRLALVCDMLIDRQGAITAYQFYPAVIHSHARLTYTQAAAWLAGETGGAAPGQQALLPQLQNLASAYRALLAARHARGAVELDSVETQIVCDEAGRITQILPRERNDAHRLIEEAMLAANVCAADFMLEGKREGLFRVHDAPPPDKLATLRSYLAALGVRAAVPDEPQPADIQRIAEQVAARPDAAQIHAVLLRSMSQALYTPANSGHFGLAYPAYAHFTSPIRRYPDLLVHRVIKAMLAGRKYALPKLPAFGEAHEKLRQRLQKNARPASAAENLPRKTTKAHQAWEAAGLHCSACERRADEASRDVQAWLKCQYMQQHLGEVFEGTVSAVTSFGLFVTLKDLYVEGLIHVSELAGDYYRFDEARQELRGERSGTRYTLGQPLRVQVARVDLDGRRIDFCLPAASADGPPAPADAPAGRKTARPAAAKTDRKPRAAKAAKAAKAARAAKPRAARSSARSSSGRR